MVDQIFENADFDQNGLITYTEFLIATLDPDLHLNKDNLTCAFRYFDVYNQNTISFEGLRLVFLRSGRLVNDTEIE